jgi:thiol peroxidase
MANVTLKGNPIVLAGPELKVGDKAPDFILQSNALQDVSLKDSAGKTRLIASVPSLDTPVCNLESKRFNEEAAKLPNVAVLVVSNDLPFAQKRWCGAENAESIQALSDHRTAKFGEAYGVLVKGGPLDRCLARAIFVVGPDDTIRHVEYVKEIAEHPNYDAALAAARG